MNLGEPPQKSIATRNPSIELAQATETNGSNMSVNPHVFAISSHMFDVKNMRHNHRWEHHLGDFWWINPP